MELPPGLRHIHQDKYRVGIKHRRDGGLQLPRRKKTEQMSNEHTLADKELIESENLLIST
jgi:hypothetical protein